MAKRFRSDFKGNPGVMREVRDAGVFRFRGEEYQYSERLHIRVLSAWTQAQLYGDQEIVLFANNATRRRMKLTPVRLQTLLEKCDNAAKRMDRAAAPDAADEG